MPFVSYRNQKEDGFGLLSRIRVGLRLDQLCTHYGAIEICAESRIVITACHKAQPGFIFVSENTDIVRSDRFYGADLIDIKQTEGMTKTRSPGARVDNLANGPGSPFESVT